MEEEITKDLQKGGLIYEALKERTPHIKDTAFDNLNESVVVSDPNRDDNPIIYANPAFYKLTGYGPEDVLNSNCRFLQGKDTDSEKVNAIRTAIKNQDPITVKLLNYKKDGTPFWNLLYIGPVEDKDGKIKYYVAIQQKINTPKE